MALTHPVILFYSSCIILFIGLIALVVRETVLRIVLQLFIIIACTMLPYLGIQISESRSQIEVPYNAVSASETYQIERYTRIVNDVFYGLNPGVLQFMEFEIGEGYLKNALQLFRMTPVLIVLIASAISLLKIKKRTALLVCAFLYNVDCSCYCSLYRMASWLFCICTYALTFIVVFAYRNSRSSCFVDAH